MRTFPCMLAAALIFATPVRAQTLKDAFEAAWRRASAGAAESARADEATARRDSGRRWLRESPALTASYKTDQIDKNAGAREIELELGVPIAAPAERRANMAVGEREADAIDAQRAVARLVVAHEVREAAWTARLAQVEAEVAERRLEEATQLAADVERRLLAGAVPRVDANQARAAQLAARAAARSAHSEFQRALAAFAQLTGQVQLPPQAESEPAALPRPEKHPLLALAQATAEAARARADQANQVRSDTPEFIVSLTRDRALLTEAYGNSIRFGVRLPLGSDVRNRTRIAQTTAERTEAEAALLLERQRLESDVALARDALASARDALALAQERARLAADTQQLIARAYALGERDLAQRLRADAERFEADLAATRAQTELGRALSRFNQSLGVLP